MLAEVCKVMTVLQLPWSLYDYNMCVWYVHSMYNTMLYLWYKCCALCDSERVLYIVCVILNMDADVLCMMYEDNK